MHFIKSLLIGAAAIVAVIAQSSPIAFTSTPASVQAGRSVVLRWGGGDDNQPVTITLKRGDANNLQTVSLITGSATGTSYTWTVPTNLPNGEDYALQINQGLNDVNYSGRFSLTGGSTASSSTSSSSATSAGTSASAIIQSAISSQNSSVTTTVAVGNATTTLGGAFGTGAVGTGAIGTGASGASGASGAATGTALPRNTTMSMATLRSSSTSAAPTTSEAATTTGSSEDSSASSTSTGAPSSGAMNAASFASPLVLVLSAVAAFVYLG
ncbi:MAG: hypothetical protein LQ343_000031 [Gyalolechia ehrenbergii]|nr:MAG: hypothetical protein LQ343_000031 [Gyalolechia ehrenbergii]